jgi:large repetitive protein
MEPRTVPDKPAWVSIWLPLGLGLVVGLTGVFMILCSLAACGDGRQASLARPELSYNGAVPFPAVVGESIVLTPAASGKLDHYRVSPSLPVGLSIDELSGVISGTPTKPSRAATYVVSAAGTGVRVSFPLVVSVTEPPSGLSYASPVNATVGVALAPLSPAVSGTVGHYAVSPALPPGVVLDSVNGVLSGTPTQATGLAPYTITASSMAGNTRFVLLLTVTPARWPPTKSR